MPDTIKSKVDDPELVQRRRQQLTEAAIELFSERGYHTTTIRDVAERASVSIGLIYQYVEDKEDLLYLALAQVLDSYKARIPQALEGVSDPLDRFCTAVRTYCRVNGESVAATVLAFREPKSLRKERRNLIKQTEVEPNELIAAIASRPAFSTKWTSSSSPIRSSCSRTAGRSRLGASPGGWTSRNTSTAACA